ncbi:AAA family ATPase [Virgibacillus sp. C22-A2]|uniref:AAA family ATPase n=1 Tax=Virgibacillus tibetensis TaxID=3042313 RepID=A0ABU6KFA2_9BACI|nr:AAA family ATPase [Virgibacillus sp. C22-A2]
MIKIYAIAENKEWMSSIEDVIKDPAYTLHWIAGESALFTKLQATEQSIVILPHAASYDVYSLCTKISQRYPLTSTLLLFNTEEELNMKKAFRAGASDVIFLSSPLSKVKEDIHLAISSVGNRLIKLPPFKTTKNAKVITVASTKGGVGKTSVAVNLAAAYGKKLEKVAVIDLDLQFGDVAMFFDVKPKRTIYDWVKEDSEGTQIEDFMTSIKNGVSILAAPQRPEFAEVITGEYVQKAIRNLKTRFDVVIIDVSSHMDENTIVALENSNDILVMTYLDLPTLKNSKVLMDTLTTLQLNTRVKVILNRLTKVKGITPETVEKVVGLKIYSILPAMDKAMITALNEGNPLVYSNPRAQVARQIFRIAENLATPVSQPVKRRHKAKRIAHAGGHA